MVDTSIEEKFSSLLNKLQELSLKLNETVHNIKDGLIPTFERSMADMQLSIDKLTSQNSQIVKRFEEQTEFLASNFTSSIDGIKAIFDINKFEDIVKKSQRINSLIEEQLKDIDVLKVTNDLKSIIDKISNKI